MNDVIQLLIDWERWQGDLVLCSEAWDTKDGLPKLTQDLNDRLIALQLRRNVVLKRLTEPPDCAYASPEDPRWQGLTP
jgi:hypothetical protein